jgi:Uma2 family endonuclease
MLVNLKAIASQVSDEELLKVSSDNPDFRFERNQEGKLIIMSPTGSSTGEKNSSLLIQVGNWNLSTKKGKVFDSSTGFKFSNGAVRSPDVSWIELSRWNELTTEQQDKFAPIAPDFVIELKSPTDKLSELQQKMLEYRSSGVRLGWLINPQDKQVEIYRQGQSKEVLDNPSSLSGEDVLSGLEVDLTDIF